MVVVAPSTFPECLKAAGLGDVQIDVLKPYAFRFHARKDAIACPAKPGFLDG
jgi:hypothetical protein